MRQSTLKRLLEIYLLLRVKQLSAQELATRFGVNLRTIYRDIEALQDAGLPIVSSTGPGGGYILNEKPGLDPLLFSSDHTLAAFFTGGLPRSANVLDDGVIEQAILDVEGHLAADDRELIQKSRQRIYLDSAEWYWQDKAGNDLQLYKDAVMHDRCIEIHFRERNNSSLKQDTVDPYGLVWKGGFWYLVGYSHSESSYRRFRITRIQSTRTTGDPFQRQSEFDLKAYWQHSLEEFGKGQTRVVLRISSSATAEFENFGWKQDNVIIKNSDHWLVEMNVDQYAWLVPIVLSFGGDMAVLEPHSLRDEISRKAENLVRAHADEERERHQSEDTEPEHGDIRSRATKGRDLGDDTLIT